MPKAALVVVACLVGTLWLPAAEAAQKPDTDGPKPAPAYPVGVEPPPAKPDPDPRAVNVRLDLTISMVDAKGVPTMPPKTATLHATDRNNGRIRLIAGNPTRDVADAPGILNVDALPTLVGRDRVRVNLTLEFHAVEEGKKPLTVNEQVSAILESGKPMIVSQTTDPSSERQVRVELKATILK